MKRLLKLIYIIVITNTNFFFYNTNLRSELIVASLHPLMSDLAKNVGGEDIKVIEILKGVPNPHVFTPKPSDLVKLKEAKIILASGKNFETYLGKLHLETGQKIYEVGKTLPSCKVEAGDLFVSVPSHSKGAVDPHWWHSINNMQRAARNLAKQFGILDPENSDNYRKNAKLYQKKLSELYAWAKREIAKIPRSDRKLVTAHAAFGYFCKDFGFKAIPVQGLGSDKEPTAKYLAGVINIIKNESIKAIFPEKHSNPKILEKIAKETGTKISGRTLIADGVDHSHGHACIDSIADTESKTENHAHDVDLFTYESMMIHNIGLIVYALGNHE